MTTISSILHNYIFFFYNNINNKKKFWWDCTNQQYLKLHYEILCIYIWYGIIYNSAFPKPLYNKINSNAKQILHAVTICIGKGWQISKIIQWIPFSIYISTKKTWTELSWKIAHVQAARVFIELDRFSIEVKSIKTQKYVQLQA